MITSAVHWKLPHSAHHRQEEEGGRERKEGKDRVGHWGKGPERVHGTAPRFPQPPRLPAGRGLRKGQALPTTTPGLTGAGEQGWDMGRRPGTQAAQPRRESRGSGAAGHSSVLSRISIRPDTKLCPRVPPSEHPRVLHEHTRDPQGPRSCCQIPCKGGPAGWWALRASTPSTAPT